MNPTRHVSVSSLARAALAATRLFAAAATLAALAVTPAWAGYLVSNDESFSYAGTVTAPNGTAYTIPSYTSTPGSTVYTGRDAVIYAASGAPAADAGSFTNATQFGANWYASLDGLNDGVGNPNSSNTGWVQIQDLANASVTSATGGWTNSSYTTFQITITGANAIGNPAFDNLWPAPLTNSALTDVEGYYEDYSLTLTAEFAPGVVTEESPGWFSTTAAPLSVTGSFDGVFVNTAPLVDTDVNGIYDVNLTFQDQSWAANNGIADVYGSYFGASEVPEPASWLIFGGGLLAMAGFRRRRAA
jgi:hypothetical protein